jgi:ATP-dependent Clp protease ATP-binding subunit ClpA
MAKQTLPLIAVIATLENRLLLGELLFFPEFARLAPDPDRLRKLLRANATRALEGLAPAELHRRLVAGPPVVVTLELPLEPLRESVAWREPLPLSFHVLHWRHGTEAFVAAVPALGIEALAGREADLNEWLPAEVRHALFRHGAGKSLRRLVALQRITRLRIETLPVAPELRSPKRRALEALRQQERKKSVLTEVGTRMDGVPLEPAYELDGVVSQLAEALTGRPAQCVLLVGPSGVGKTAAVRELVRRRSEFQLGHTPFWATSGSRLVAGMTGFGMWQERCREVARDAAKRRAVLHLGSLVELMQVGKSEHQHSGIASFLRPYLARGEVLAIAECTPEQVPLIEREGPHLLDAFRRIEVTEPDAVAGRVILERAAGPLAALRGSAKPQAADALDELDRLHRRYATGSAFPGRPLRFLRNLLQDQRDAPTVTAAAVRAAFARETGLPRVLLDPSVPLDLAVTRQWFGERVLGQPEAVDLVVDLLATVKAGLSRPGRPIASLLFIGPTGVGKTELAKSLAEFLFGSRRRLTRFDLSEYADPISVQRLAGGVFGAEGLLTAAVREQPFAVVLLDEFEKAHPSLFDLLLQVLGEGRLTDAAGRLADFRNAVVILTSNLGAESYQPAGYGFGRPGDDAREQARQHFVREVQAFVRPEFFNRIDRLVPFAPLDADTIRRIAARELKRLEDRDGVRYRGVELQFPDAVAAHLGRHGFDIRYGARPLQRAIERELLAPVADGMNRYAADLPVRVRAEVEPGDRLRIEVKPRTDAAGRAVAGGGASAERAGCAGRCVDLRRETQRLEACAAVRELQNDLFQLERLEQQDQKEEAKWQRRAAKRVAKGRPAPPRRRPLIDGAQRERLARLRQLAAAVGDVVSRSHTLEDEALLSLNGQGLFEPADLAREADGVTAAFDDLLLDLYCQRFPTANAVTLALFADDAGWLFELAAAYRATADAARYRVDLYAYRLPPGGQVPRNFPPIPINIFQRPEPGAEPRPVWFHDVLFTLPPGGAPTPLLVRESVAEPGKYLADADAEVVGLALRFTGKAAYPMFASEEGLHRLEAGQQVGRCLVEVGTDDLDGYTPPQGVTRRGSLDRRDLRRTYDRRQNQIEDSLAKKPLPWFGRDIGPALGDILREMLKRNVRTVLD